MPAIKRLAGMARSYTHAILMHIGIINILHAYRCAPRKREMSAHDFHLNVIIQNHNNRLENKHGKNG